MVEHSPQSLGFFHDGLLSAPWGTLRTACDAEAWSHSQHAVGGRHLPVTWRQASYWLQPTTPVWPFPVTWLQAVHEGLATHGGAPSMSGGASPTVA